MGRECRGVREPKQKRTSITSKFSVKLVLGVECGARTHDTRNHNPMLYQLS